MCLGVPGQVVEITDPATHLALVDVSGVRRKVNIGLLVGNEHPGDSDTGGNGTGGDGTAGQAGVGSGVAPGDWVLIHVGFALNKIDEDEARATLEMLAGMGQAYDDELAALAESRIE